MARHKEPLVTIAPPAPLRNSARALRGTSETGRVELGPPVIECLICEDARRSTPPFSRMLEAFEHLVTVHAYRSAPVRVTRAVARDLLEGLPLPGETGPQEEPLRESGENPSREPAQRTRKLWSGS